MGLNIGPRKDSRFLLGRLGFFVIFFVGLMAIRVSKGALFIDFYALISRPFWPGTAQKEWLSTAQTVENSSRLTLLEIDNERLRGLLKLHQSSDKDKVLSAAVISRRSKGWWQQLDISKGSIHGIQAGDSVLGPGGLVGLVQSVTPLTSRVRLLTSPGSKIGVWLPKSQSHALLVGVGSSRPQLQFIENEPRGKPGDLVSTSPASTLLPPNVPVGVIYSIDRKAIPAPNAMVQLIAFPEAIDWVQVNIK